MPSGTKLLTPDDHIKFLMACLNAAGTINYDIVVNETGLPNQKSAYKKLWDLKRKYPLGSGTTVVSGFNGAGTTPSPSASTSPAGSPSKRKEKTQTGRVGKGRGKGGKKGVKKELVHEVEDLLEDVSGGAYVCDEWQEEVQRVKRPARKAKMGEKRYADQDDGDTDMDTEGAAENGEEGGEEEEAHGTVVVAMANGMQKGAREEQLEEDEEGELSGAEIDAK